MKSMERVIKKQILIGVFLVILLMGCCSTLRAQRTPKIEKARVLLTGFEPYGKWDKNPSSEIVKSLDGKVIGGAKIYGIELPVSFREAGRNLSKTLNEIKPHVLISIGLSPRVAGIEVERVAINVMDAKIPDNAGYQPVDVPIVRNGETAYFATIPIKEIVDAMQQKRIPSYVSNTAGTFLCNFVMYGGLYHSDSSKFPMKSGLIHVPCLPGQVVDESTPSMSLELMIEAIEEAIECSVEDMT